jgi:hypothetical protein
MEKTAQRRASWFIHYTKYYLGKQIKNDGISGQVALNGEKRNAYKVLGRKSEENRPLKRPRRSWEDNIKMDVKNRTGGFRPD